jgi:hypothetical protein
LGVDFTAVLDHGLTWEELCRLPATLNSCWAAPASLRALVSAHPGAGTDWHWQISPSFSSAAEELFDEGFVHLAGPSCFSATVFRRAIEVTSCARWWSFLFEQDVRTGLLEGVRGLAGTLESSTVIYLPDSAYPPSAASDRLYEGAGVAEVVSWLEANVGPAAPSLDAIRGAGEDHWDESGYVIERVDGIVEAWSG